MILIGRYGRREPLLVGILVTVGGSGPCWAAGAPDPVLGTWTLNLAKSKLKKDGKVAGSTTRTISARGKVMTLSTKATDVKGVAHDEVAVYDKQ
jgi:hypothetical protein